MQDTRPLIVKSHTDFPPLLRGKLQILQVNLGYVCNLSCTHCHVNAGPHRTESMPEALVALVLDACDRLQVETLDLTGGAPELNPHFRTLVNEARKRGVNVIDRCNLTILHEPGQDDLAEFLAAQGVQIVASLPCYSQANVDKQRGKGVFEHSIDALKQLNALGYGSEGQLVLDLVYNPGGAFLPPSQVNLEADYKTRLWDDFGIRFNRLLTLTNMPISRFGAVLLSQGQFDGYMQLLRENYAAGNLAGVMCRNTLSIDWQGYLYDCDFNQMLDLPLELPVSQRVTPGKVHLRDVLTRTLEGNSILVADHCFGCTAGQGSSCGGALR